MKTVMIWSMKGGVLKTTLSVNLSCVMALEGYKVLIVDTDGQSDVAVSWNINVDKLEYTLYDVLMDSIPPELAIENVYKGDGLIDILPSNSNLLFFTESRIKNNNRFSVLGEKLKHLKRRYDYIIVDTPPSLSLMIGNAFAFADKVIIPFQCEQYARRSLVNVIKIIEDIKENVNNELEILGVVATIVEKHTNLHSDILQDTRKFCDLKGIKMFDTVIPKSINFASSIGYDGLPLILNKPKHQLSKIYYELWEEIINE